MARLSVQGNQVVVRLNWLEKFGSWSIRDPKAPVSSIERVEVVDNPHDRLLREQVDFGFAGNTAPAAWVMSLGTRAKARGGGRAVVAVYLNRPAVVIRLAANDSPWRLVIVSTKNAASTAAAMTESAAL